MPLWFWLNVPACILFFLAFTGVPMWLVLTRPDKAPIPDGGPGPGPGSVERARPLAAASSGR
jgi:hypothetical protein